MLYRELTGIDYNSDEWINSKVSPRIPSAWRPIKQGLQEKEAVWLFLALLVPWLILFCSRIFT